MSAGRKTMDSGRCAAGTLTIVILVGAAFGAGVTRKDLHFKVGKHSMVSVNNQYGTVRVKAGVPHQVSVTAILHSDKVELDQATGGNRIHLISHLLPGSDETTGIVEYEMTVPPDASLTLHSGNSATHVERLHGDLMMEGNNGPMEIVDCGDGHIHIRTLDGKISLTNVHNGHVEISSMGGDVVLSGVDGPFVKVNSNNGKIQYDGDFSDSGIYDFSSYTGNIEALAPPYASIDVLARSTNGPVQSDFSLEPKHTPFVMKVGSAFSGTLGKAASSVNLFSFSGKIHLKKRQN
jgi:Putative adhesin